MCRSGRTPSAGRRRVIPVPATAWVLLGVAGLFAAGDWIAVAAGVRGKKYEYLLKPATMVALIGVAIALRPEHPPQRTAFLVGLILSLAGDVFLMLPRDAFVAGLASFLLAHIAYVTGFALAGTSPGWVAVGAVVVALGAASVGRAIVQSVRAGGHPALLGPVVAYVAVISAMVVVAIGSGDGFAAAGALLFYTSDSLIAWDRFVSPRTWARPAIMITYHLAQAGLVVSLIR